MKKITSLTFIFLISFVTYGQKYIDIMNDPSVNVYEVIKEAENYFKIHPDKGRGTGWKQYQRWKYYNESRFYPSGNRTLEIKDPSTMQRLRSTSNKVSSSKSVMSITGNWKELGPLRPHYSVEKPIAGVGRTENLWIDPSDENYIYTSSRTGGFWKSTDGGYNWTSSTQDLGVAGCNDFGVSYQDRDIIYMGTSGGKDFWNLYGIGMLKSIDGGTTWQTTSFSSSPSNSVRINEIKVHPTDDNIIYFGTSIGLYKTTDGLASHTLILSGNVQDIEFKPGDPTTIYAVSGTTVHKSTNSGTSFSALTGVLGKFLAVSDADPNYLYATNQKVVYKSTNAGASFTSSAIVRGSYGGFCASNTDAETLLLGTHFLYLSTNGGTNFTKIGLDYNYIPFNEFSGWDHRFIMHQNGAFYSANDANITKTTDLGVTWSQLIKGDLPIRENYAFGSSPTSPYLIVTGSQDHGVNTYTNGEWEFEYTGDGMDCFYDLDEENTFFYSTQNGSLKRNVSDVITNITPTGENGNGNWQTPFIKDPVDANTIYAGYNDLYKSTNNGASWNTVGTLPSISSVLEHIAVAPSNNNYIYMSSQSKIVFTSTAKGAKTWSDISSGLPNLWITAIAIDPTDELTAYVALTGYTNGSKVYKTTNAGQNWTNISGTLPNLPTLSLVADNTANNGIYLGMDVGIYYLDDNHNDWSSFDAGLPNISAKTLELVPAINKIRVGTWGRGLWESDIYEADNLAPAAEFTPDNFNPTPGGSVVFTDRSSGNPTSWTWSFPGGTPSSSTSQNPTVTYNSVGIYDVTLTVTNTNGSDLVTKTNFIAVENKTYCTASGKIGTGGDWINNVSYNDLNYNSGVVSGVFYSDFTSETATVIQGETHTLSVSLNSAFPADRIFAWIDWNNNSLFDASELVLSGDPTDGSNGSLSSQITVPSGAALGPTRMRVRNQFHATANGNPCGNNFYGEVEDYTIIVESTLNVDEETLSNFTIYPIPSNHNIYIRAKPGNEFSIEIFDIYGRIHLKRPYKTANGNQVVEVPLDDIGSGIYFVRIYSEDFIQTQKIIVNKQPY